MRDMEYSLCYYAYYNLAKYFYLDGYMDIVINKDIDKAINYFEIAYKNGIDEALIELFFIYYINSFKY